MKTQSNKQGSTISGTSDERKPENESQKFGDVTCYGSRRPRKRVPGTFETIDRQAVRNLPAEALALLLACKGLARGHWEFKATKSHVQKVSGLTRRKFEAALKQLSDYLTTESNCKSGTVWRVTENSGAEVADIPVQETRFSVQNEPWEGRLFAHSGQIKVKAPLYSTKTNSSFPEKIMNPKRRSTKPRGTAVGIESVSSDDPYEAGVRKHANLLGFGSDQTEEFLRMSRRDRGRRSQPIKDFEQWVRRDRARPYDAKHWARTEGRRIAKQLRDTGSKRLKQNPRFSTGHQTAGNPPVGSIQAEHNTASGMLTKGQQDPDSPLLGSFERTATDEEIEAYLKDRREYNDFVKESDPELAVIPKEKLASRFSEWKKEAGLR